MGKRSLKNVYSYPKQKTPEDIYTTVWQQFENADNMSDQYTSFAILCSKENQYRS